MPSYTHFCCRAGGNNMNAGTVDGGDTEPSVSPLVTYTGGDWNATSDVYTAPAGADMTEAVVGRFASLYFDGNVVPTSAQYLVSRITAVNAGARQITLGGTSRANLGSEVVTATGTRSMRIGGAWAGPSGTSGFPFTLGLLNAINVSSHPARINLKNDQSYTMTAGSIISYAAATGTKHLFGYASTYEDGGRTILGAGSGTSAVLLAIGATPDMQVHNIDFNSNGTTGNAALVTATGSANLSFHHCIFRNSRGAGFSVLSTASSILMHECEITNNNLSNGSTLAGITVTGTNLMVNLVNCLIHSHPGTNGVGLRLTGGALTLINCIIRGNSSHGVTIGASTACSLFNCDIYSNGGAGINALQSSNVLANCNLVKNTTYGVTSTVISMGWIFNCGFGSGTQANTSGAVNDLTDVENIGAVTYPSNTPPWVDPVNGDFRINLAAAKDAGRMAFLDSTGVFTGTVGYPDIGAAPHAAMPERTDTFNRGDRSGLGPPSDGGPPWVEVESSAWEIFGNQAGTGASSSSLAYLESTSSDCDVQVTLQNMVAHTGLLGRFTDDANYLSVEAESDTAFFLRKRVANTTTILGSWSGAMPTVGDVIKLHMDGSSLTVFINGVSRITATDSFNSTVTNHGILSLVGVDARLEDFSIRELVPTSTSTAVLTTGKATLAAAAAFSTIPTFTAAAALSPGGTTLSGSASRTLPAIRYLIAGGNGLWSDPSNWSGTSGGGAGAPAPVAGDAVLFDSSSGNANITVNVPSACASLIMSGTYAGTLTFNAQLMLTSTCTFLLTCTIAGTAGTLNPTGTATLTSGGKTLTCALTFPGTNQTFTLADDWLVNGLVTAGSASSNLNVNGVGRTLTCAGGFHHGGVNSAVLGTAKLVLVGGTWDSTSTGTLATDVDLAGNVTVSGTVVWGTSSKTLRYVSGTITTTGSTLVLYTTVSARVLDTAGVTWNNVTVSGTNETVTLNSALAWAGTLTVANSGTTFNGAGQLNGTGSVAGTLSTSFVTLNNTGGLVTTGTLTLPNGACTFAGTAGFTVGTLTTATLTGSRIHTLTYGRTYTVNTALANVGATAAIRQALKSSSPGNRVVFNVTPGATVNLSYCDPTDINSSGGKEILSTSGVITNSLNWINAPVYTASAPLTTGKATLTATATFAELPLTAERTDTFNRADNPISLGTPSDGGRPWYSIVPDGWRIVSNQAASDGHQPSLAYLESTLSDCELQITIVAPTEPSGQDMGILCRYVDVNNYLIVTGAFDNGYSIYAVSAGSPTLQDEYPSGPASGDVLKVRMEGTAITVYVNGVARLTATSSIGLTATRHGLYNGLLVPSSDTRADDFTVRTLAATFTATASLITGKATLVGTATFTKPTYRVTTAPLTASKATLAGTATFTKPTYRVTTAPLTSSKAMLAGTATFRPTRTAAATLTSSKAILAGVATFVQPTYRVLTAPLTTGKALLAGTAAVTAPTFPALANYTNFCCRLGGNNLNAGTVDGSTVEPAITPLATYVGGDWNPTTDVYTAPAGADMAQAVVGHFAALCHDGAVVPANNQFLVAQIDAVNVGTRQITLSATSRALWGTEVVSGTGTRTLRIGGAWLGPNGATPWLDNFPSRYLTDPDGHNVRVNLKNDQIYDITAVITLPASAVQFIQGYTSSYDDGGRAVLRGPAAGASIGLLTAASASVFTHIADMEFTRNGSTGSAAAVQLLNTYSVLYRCVAHDLRGSGFWASSVTELHCTECEAYACNLANASLQAAFYASGSYGNALVNCIAHDNPGSINDGFRMAAGVAVNCIADTNGRFGFYLGTTATPAALFNCDTYANRVGVYVSSNATVHLYNCNFVFNQDYGISGSDAAAAFAYNCGFGTGSAANGEGATSGNVELVAPISYAPGVTPWVDPTTGDFRINLAAAQGGGHGAFLQTAPGYTGTVAYPDVGAAAALDGS